MGESLIDDVLVDDVLIDNVLIDVPMDHVLIDNSLRLLLNRRPQLIRSGLIDGATHI